MIYTAVIEQTFAYPKRMRYIPATGTFVEKEQDSLSFIRDFHQPSGWIKESGTPPCEHLDVIVMTDRQHELGDEVQVKIVGVFCRNDGDHKLIAVTADRAVDDISGLTEAEIADLHRLYTRVDKGEGWFGRERAGQVVSDFFSRKKRKFIIMVQHTESLHHINGCIGAWGDWELTQRGREQAYEIGKWLLYEDCGRAYEMYVSDLKRAMQTAEEINRTLGITPVVTDVIREVNAGQGNGQTRGWYHENAKPRGTVYDPNYKPFPDAESDRELWDRLYPFYREITGNAQERLIIVSHGTALSFLQSMMMGCSFGDIQNYRFNGSGGSVSKFIIEPSGKTIACYINQRVC